MLPLKFLQTSCSDHKKIIVFCVFLLTMSSTLYKEAQAATEINQLFNQGSLFFEQGRYQQAASAFKQAQNQGLNSPALLFNLGSSYYKLKRYKLAEKYYLQLRKFPKMRTIAEYNLALTASKQKNTSKTRQWLKSVVDSGQNQTLIALARKKLNLIAASADNKRYYVYTSAGMGQDSNINIADISASSLSDSYSQLILSGNYLFNGLRSSGWFTELSYYQRRYTTETLFNDAETSIGISKRQRIKDWLFKYALQQASTHFGGKAYQTSLRLNLYANYRLKRGEKLNFAYRFNDINSEIQSTSLQGTRQNIKFEYFRYQRHTSQRLSYELELNNRQDSATSSFSPTRHKLRYQHYIYFDNHWRLTTELSLRQSNYPVVGLEKRSDKRIRALLGADYRFTKTLKLKMTYAYTDNQSNIPTDSYNKRIISLSVSQLF